MPEAWSHVTGGGPGGGLLIALAAPIWAQVRSVGRPREETV